MQKLLSCALTTPGVTLLQNKGALFLVSATPWSRSTGLRLPPPSQVGVGKEKEVVSEAFYS